MAESAKKKTRRRAPQTVRERSESSLNTKPKRRIVQKTATGISKPIKAIWNKTVQLLKPFSFVLKPFKTKPFRLIGRIISKILLISYFKNSWKELKQVSWPSRKETWSLTFSVFAFAAVFGLLVTVVDYGLDKIFKALILK